MSLFEHLASEPFARQMGIAIDEIRPGYARVSLTLADWMTNVHGTAHGGMIFGLADVAFAAASNSHGTTAVALNMDIQYLSAGHPGQRLVAEAAEIDLTRRTALYRITVSDEETGKQVAALHARVYRLDRPVLPEA